MKTLLAKLAQRKAVGVHIGDGELVASQVAATPFGPVEVRRHSQSYAADEFPAAFERLLTDIVGPPAKCRKPIGASIPAQRIFFSTRPVKSINAEASPEALLHEVLQSPTINIDDMVIDLIQSNSGKRPVASLVATRRKYFSSILGTFQGCGVRPHRIEPAPCALLRAAARYRAPRKAKSVLRVFLGADEGMAVLESFNHPLVWRTFKLPPQDQTRTAIIATVRTLQTLGKHCGTDALLDAVLIHGRADLRTGIDLGEMKQELAVRVTWHDGPGLDASAIAYGVACGCLNLGEKEFDLARSLKPQASLRQMFPWGQVVFQILLLVVMALVLANYSTGLSSAYADVLAESQRHTWLSGATDQDLQKEKKYLTDRVDAVRIFLGTRVLWTGYTRDIPARLPKDATLNSFQGFNDLESIGKKREMTIKPKKSFVLRVGAPITRAGAIPKDIDGFLDALRGHPLLKNDFPQVELADIKWFQPFMGAQPTAFFTIICTPKQSGPAGGGDKAAPAKSAEN